MNREEKKAQTRAALAASARALIGARGFDETTIAQLAADAGVSRRTFFRYFDSKEAAFFANQEDRLATFAAWLDARPLGEGAYAAVRRCCLAMAAVYMDERALALAQHRALRSSATLAAYDLVLDARWEALITSTLAAEAPTPLAAALQGGAIIGVVRAGLRAWFEGGAARDLVAIGRDAFELLEQGFNPDLPTQEPLP